MSGSTDSPRRSGSDRPEHPWLPGTLHVWGVYPRERPVWVTDTRTGDRERKRRKRYDVRFHVDGHEFRRGFDQKGWADDFARQLQHDFAHGRLFDPEARRFLPPEAAPPRTQDEGPTFYAYAREYVSEKWHRWQPASRPDAQRAFARACIHLVREEAEPLAVKQRQRADAFLRQVALGGTGRPDTSEEREWHAWFEKWSLPLADITDNHLRSLLEWLRSERLDGTKRRAAANTVNRARGVLRGAFTHARKRRLIDWDPWTAVEAEPVQDHNQVDPDLVMDTPDILALAARCGAITPRYEAFVLVQGFCGLRAGEAIELRRRDLVLDSHPSVTVRGSHSAIPQRFFLDGEGRRRPLKGRGPKARRTIPVPSLIVPALRHHLEHFVDGSPSAVAFTNTTGGRILTSNLRRDIWYPARAAAFPEDSPLAKVRLHDLRHSAITTWLNAGVPLKTAQKWSGHKTLSVMLDTYLGVMKGDEATARDRFEAAANPDLVTGS